MFRQFSHQFTRLGLRSRPLTTYSPSVGQSLSNPSHRHTCQNILLPRTLRLSQRHFSSTTPNFARYVRFDDNNPYSNPKRDQEVNPHRNTNPWDGRIKIIVVVGVLGGVYYIVHLEQVPETGRWRFMNTSAQFEAKYGEMARAQVRNELREEILPYNHPVSRHVRRVVQRILASNNLGLVKGMSSESHPSLFSPRSAIDGFGGDSWDPDKELRAATAANIGPEREWDVIVVNNPKVMNAMAVPGMTVVFTGILPICQDEQGLAAVISHEIGHIVARHTAERISSQTVVISFLVLMSLIGIDFGLSGIIKDLMLELPNSRTQEREADYIGLTLMAKACFDPKASPEMFERLDKVESKIATRVNLDFLQTHPSSKSRVEYLKQALPEAYAVRASNPECGDLEDKLNGFREAGHNIRVEDI